MRCKTATRRLTPYLDDRLGDRDRLELGAHLSGCASCRETQALLVAARTALATQGPAEPTPGLAARAANEALAAAPRPARAQEPAGEWLRLLGWPALATASAAATLALVLFAQSPGPGAPPEPRDAAATFAQLAGLDDADLDPLEEGARVLGQEVE